MKKPGENSQRIDERNSEGKLGIITGVIPKSILTEISDQQRKGILKSDLLTNSMPNRSVTELGCAFSRKSYKNFEKFLLQESTLDVSWNA